MTNAVYEMAKRYYPRLWNTSRITALRDAGKITAEQADEILNDKET